MTKIFLPLLLAFCFTIQAQENFNVELIGSLDYDVLLSDVWGYVAEDGTEYAIIGLFTGTAVISLEDPANPTEVLFVPGAESIWRDMKIWDNYVYVVADRGTDGFLIIDMSMAPDSFNYHFHRPEITINNALQDPLGRCHNIWIDEKGYAYLSGCRPQNNGGVLIFDLNEDPEFPSFVGAAAPIYSHDNFVRNDMMYSADIIDGFFSIHDVSDRTSPVLLATQNTTSTFTHNCWLSDDGKYLFTTDERPESYVDAYDVSDPSDIKYISSFRPITNKGQGVIPHNVHYHEGFLYVSWYTDGVIIVDAHKPDNMVKVGQYDTFLGPHGDFNGHWGAYPFLPSGLLLSTDRQNGFFVFYPQHTRASYLEGRISSLETGLAVHNAKIFIEADVLNEAFSTPDGIYKTGTAFAGTYEIRVTHPDYEDYLSQADLLTGITTVYDIQLRPLGTNIAEAPPLELDQEFVIFPNPTSGHLTISFPQHIANNLGPFRFALFDLSGKEIIQSSLFTTYLEIDLSYLPFGLYVGELVNSNSSINLKEKIYIQN
ncbi:MAG: choice-of-anchor B family protein [Saprospirales bacterium]|nr:MAG: choice-of-anchor B family protein [Saprospirales bacterium]